MTVQQVRSPGGATEAKQDAVLTSLGNILTELGQKLEAGGEVALSATTLAALEIIQTTISNFPDTYPDGHPDPQLDALTNTELRAADVNVADSGERVYPKKNMYVTAAGDTTVLTPSAGKAIRVRKIQAVNRPTATTTPLISLRFGSSDAWWSNFVIMTRQRHEGGVGEPLIVNLDEPGQVAVTIVYEEI